MNIIANIERLSAAATLEAQTSDRLDAWDAYAQACVDAAPALLAVVRAAKALVDDRIDKNDENPPLQWCVDCDQTWIGNVPDHESTCLVGSIHFALAALEGTT